MAAKGRPPAPTRGRDAGTGQFVPIKYAKDHPKTTVVEQVRGEAKSGAKRSRG